jgi:hypothetical protein
MQRVGFVAVILSIVAFGSRPSGAPAKPGTFTPVPLEVTMNACTVSTLSEICGDAFALDGDGNTTYADGQDGVRANIDQYGNVIIDFQTTRAKIRGLVYKYGDGSTSTPPGGGSNHYFSTIGLAPGSALQAMQPGGPSITVASCPLYDDDSGQPQYRHGFSRDCQSGFGSVGSPLLVTRTSPTTWQIQPAAPATARVFSITTKGRVDVQDFGEFTLPFTMTLTAK